MVGIAEVANTDTPEVRRAKEAASRHTQVLVLFVLHATKRYCKRARSMRSASAPLTPAFDERPPLRGELVAVLLYEIEHSKE